MNESTNKKHQFSKTQSGLVLNTARVMGNQDLDAEDCDVNLDEPIEPPPQVLRRQKSTEKTKELIEVYRPVFVGKLSKKLMNRRFLHL